MTTPVPGLPIDPTSLIPPDLAANVQKFFFGPTTNGAVAAPACKQQGKFPFGGEVTSTPTSTPRPGRPRGPWRAPRRPRTAPAPPRTR